MTYLYEESDLERIRRKYGNLDPEDRGIDLPMNMELADNIEVTNISWKYLNPAREASIPSTNSKKVSFKDQNAEQRDEGRAFGDQFLDAFHIIDKLKQNIDQYRRSDYPLYSPMQSNNTNFGHMDFFPSRTSTQILKEKRRDLENPLREPIRPSTSPDWYRAQQEAQSMDDKFRVMTEEDIRQAIRKRLQKADARYKHRQFAEDHTRLKGKVDSNNTPPLLRNLKAIYHTDISQIQPNVINREDSRERGLFSKVITQICLKGLAHEESKEPSKSSEDSFMLIKDMKLGMGKVVQNSTPFSPLKIPAKKRSIDSNMMVVPIAIKTYPLEDTALNYSYSKDGSELYKSAVNSKRFIPSDLISIVEGGPTNFELSKLHQHTESPIIQSDRPSQRNTPKERETSLFSKPRA